jgi:hypothetical protein
VLVYQQCNTKSCLQKELLVKITSLVSTSEYCTPYIYFHVSLEEYSVAPFLRLPRRIIINTRPDSTPDSLLRCVPRGVSSSHFFILPGFLRRRSKTVDKEEADQQLPVPLDLGVLALGPLSTPLESRQSRAACRRSGSTSKN